MIQPLDGDVSGKSREIPEATIARLAVYLRTLNAMGDSKFATSSDELAAAAGVSSATLRKDLSSLGTYGVRGVGYEIELLIAEIGRALGAHRQHRVALVGVGNLGAALAGYPGFVSRGLAIGALFDVDPHRIGQFAGGHVIEDVADIVASCRREAITIGVIATSVPAAQSAANALVSAGVRAILAFTPGFIQVPPGVDLRKVDLAVELQILAFHESRRQHGERRDNIRVNNDDMLPADDAAVKSSTAAPLSTLLDGSPSIRSSVAVTSVSGDQPSSTTEVHLAGASRGPAQAPSTRSVR